jgi:cytochrome c nitrite reductase small subunit
MKKYYRNIIHILTFSLAILAGTGVPLLADAPEKGVSTAELMRESGIVAIILALLGIILVEFVFKHKISRSLYKWILFTGLFILPVFAMVSAFTTLMEETKTVASCASCHVMHPFVYDMFDQESPNLAARHYKNKWIPDNQCYHCHTSYGIHGTLEAKRDGFRHWLMYVTETWPDPITFKGSYPNQNCYACHFDTPKFDAVQSHLSLKDKLMNDEVSCSSCHGPVHPTPAERPGIMKRIEYRGADDAEEIKDYLKQLPDKH